MFVQYMLTNKMRETLDLQFKFSSELFEHKFLNVGVG